jgi:DNA-binding LacI/PurR family transcriptional regulator
MTELLTSGETIDAVAAASDKMAIGAMRAIRMFGLTIPDDISIIGFDNLETANFVTPRLTTVDYPKEELGRLAVRILSENITERASAKGKRWCSPPHWSSETRYEERRLRFHQGNSVLIASRTRPP